MVYRSRMQLNIFCIALFLSACSNEYAEAEDFSVHAHRDKGEIATYAYIVETSQHSVLVDAGFSAAAGEEIKTILDEIGKPVAAVLLTHAHPGHYGGITAAVGTNVPVIADVGVARQFSEYDEKFQKLTGGGLPENRRGPDTIYGHGQSLRIDSVDFTLNAMGPGEAEVDTWWSVSQDDKKAVFAGGLIAYEIHPILTGHSGSWINSLKIMREEIAPLTPIYPGYNPRAENIAQVAGHHELIEWQIEYLNNYRSVVADVAEGRVQLSDAELTSITNKMNDLYPDNRALIFIQLGAETVAAELALQAALDRTDLRFQELFK